MIILLRAVVVVIALVTVFRVDLLAQVLPLPIVILQDVLLDVGAVVSRAVPPQADARLGPCDHFRRNRFVRLARLGLERDGVGRAALECVVDGVDADVVLGARPQVGQPALDRGPGED